MRRGVHFRWVDRALFIWLYRRYPRILDASPIYSDQRAMTHGGPLAGVRADNQFESVLVKGHDFDPVRALAGRVTSDRL